jgi:hypothetical protein
MNTHRIAQWMIKIGVFSWDLVVIKSESDNYLAIGYVVFAVDFSAPAIHRSSRRSVLEIHIFDEPQKSVYIEIDLLCIWKVFKILRRCEKCTVHRALVTYLRKIS